MKKMLGSVGINYIEQPYRVINNNYRNIMCLVAPFKDDSFVFKVYNSLKEAVDGEKVVDDNVKGYHYLELLYQFFPEMPEIILCNTTTNTAEEEEPPEYDYNLTNERLAEIFEELDEVGISFLVIPEELNIPQYMMYKSFYDEQRNKMNAFGLIHYVKPNTMVTIDDQGETIPETPLLELLFELEDGAKKPTGIFSTGGSWKTVTTPVKLFDEEPMTMEDSVIYHAGVTANHAENISETHYVLDNIEGLITKKQYGKEAFDLINNSGAIAVSYRDKIHKICQVYNSGTQTWNENLENTYDLKIERVHALMINELRIGLLELAGKDNDKVSYDDFESLARNTKDTYKGAGYITDLLWTVNKKGTAKILVLIEEKQRNIITQIDVIGQIMIE